MADSNEITALIKQAQQGNSQSFGSLVLNYEKFIYNTAFRMLSNAEDARDIAQEALIKAYKNIDKFDFNSSFSTWLYRITVNTCIDELRKRKGKETYSTDSQDEETGLYDRIEECHYEKAYDIEEIKELIEKSGMEFVAAFDAFTFNEPNEKSERICIVAMEKGK